MLRAALRYAALGWYVFPLAITGDVKEPHGMLGKPGGHNAASVDPEELRGWWARSPASGIGLNLAKSGLIAIDTDPRSGGTETIARVEAARGPLKSAIVNETGGGGDHRLFLAPEGLKSAPGRIGPPGGGVDLKYNGYIVLPPSRWAGRGPDRKFLPPSGPGYRWRAGCDPFGGGRDYLYEIPAWVLSSGSEVAVRKGVVDDEDVFREDTPKCGLDEAEIAENLDLVPNTGDDELEYEDWINVLAGIRHETDGSPEGKALALAWSERAMKHDAEKFEKSWGSLDITGKGRAPVTFRFVIKLASERKKVEEKRSADEIETKIRLANDIPALLVVAAEIKKTELHALFRNGVVAQFQARYKEVTGKTLPIAEARRLTRYEDPEVSEPPAWLEGWVYCGQNDEFYKAGTRQTLTAAAFNHTFNERMLTRQERAEGKASPEVIATDAALNRYKIPKVYGHMYYPGQPEEFTFQGSTYINTYTDRSQPIIPEAYSPADRLAIKRVVDHFHLLARHPDEVELVLSWYAHIVQTLQRPNWALAFQSAEGVGKSFLLELFGAILGSENVQPIFAAKLMDKASFNEWSVGSLISVVDEIKQNSENRFIIMDKLQQVITNDTISLHEKGKGIRPVRNTAGYTLLTNHRDALPVHLGDSRYFMVTSRLQTKAQVDQFNAENPDYFADLFTAVNEHAGALRKWFLEYKLSSRFNPKARAPRSREHAHAVRLGVSDNQATLDDILADSQDVLVCDACVCVTYLREAFIDRVGEAPTGHTWPRLLMSRGFEHLGRFFLGKSRHHFWTRTPEAYGEDPLPAITDRAGLR